MASQYVNLWSTPGKYIGIGNQYSGGKDYRAVYDSKNKAYWGQHDQKTLLDGIQNVINTLTQQIKDGGITTLYNPGIGSHYRFNKFNDQQLQEATQRLAESQKYFEGISNNYTKFNDFEKSYDQYRGDWDALFNQTFKNTRIEADNLAKAANAKEANEQIQAPASGAVESLAIKPNKTTGTGLKTSADKPGTSPFKSGLGI